MFNSQIEKTHRLAKRGFTLIELLIVIGIIAILAAFVFVMLNPLARFQDARNARRWTDINALLAAIKLNQVDNKGIFHTAITNEMSPGLYYQIGSGESNITCDNPDITIEPIAVDFDSLVSDGYLPSMPYDPNATGASPTQTHYYIGKDSNNVILIGACGEEHGSGATTPDISVKM